MKIVAHEALPSKCLYISIGKKKRKLTLKFKAIEMTYFLWSIST